MGTMDTGEKFALGSEAEQQPWQEAYRALIESFEPQRGERYVGRSIPRNDVLYKVRGKAKYVANLSLPGMLHARFVRSIHPYARIKRVDVTKAARLPGVACVLTAEDIPEERLNVGLLVKDSPVLAKGVVRHVGEPIVAIAADTIETAHAAADLVEIEYEPLEPVLTPEDALKENAPKLHPDGNLIANLRNAVGNVDDALKEADVVVDDVYTNEPIEHAFLEPQGGLSFIDEGGVLTLMVCTQYPHFHHKQLADVTGLPLEKIRVVQTVVGGAFGGKIDVTVEIVSSLMTLKTGRPVKMLLESDEVFAATTKRHAMRIHHRLGAMKDGRIIALDMDILADGGAYSSYSLVVAGRCVVHASLPYDIPNVRARMRTTFTNNVTAGAMRSFGIVKLAFATESQIDKIARRLGISPIEIRRINAVRTGTKTVTGQVLHAVGFKKTLDEIESIYNERRSKIATEPAEPGIRRGLGVASLGYGIGYSGARNPSTARIEVTSEGLVIANCGTPDIGPGSDTTLAQIVAEEIGVNLGRIRIVSGDSTKTDDSGPTSASRTTYFSGNAAMFAARDFKVQFIARLAGKLGLPVAAARIDNDRVIINNKPISFEEACTSIGADAANIRAYGVFNPDSQLDLVTFKGSPYPTYTYATQLAEVEVDTETGKVNVTRYWAAHDAGRIVNPIGAEGQIEGGVVMGLGMALWEKIVRNGGFIQNPGMRDYLLPGAKDAPPEITAIFIENADETGPYGAKGVAEPSLVPVPAAVGAAIYDAVGIRLNHLPMEAQSVLHELRHRA